MIRFAPVPPILVAAEERGLTHPALVMIPRDGAHEIARGLESARPHVDRMIVIGTGSMDAAEAWP